MTNPQNSDRRQTFKDSQSDKQSTSRLVFGSPQLLQDWHSLSSGEQDERQYWQLFLDLLLVAAAAALTDQFKEDLSWGGFREFIVFYLIIINGWLLYSPHITSRFKDSSFAHTVVLFIYCFGFGIEIVHSGWDGVFDFAIGAFIQRVSILIMLATFAVSIPRARYFCGALGAVIACSTVIFGIVIALSLDGKQTPHLVISTLMWVSAIMELCAEIILIGYLETHNLIPVNVEQTKERLSALELICLGETILSVCIIYRKSELGGPGSKYSENSSITAMEYYSLLGFSFLMVFMFLLLYFHIQPSPDHHAIRRSKAHGTAVLILHRLLGMPFLVLSTVIKIVVEFYLSAGNKPFPAFGSRLVGYSIGTSLLLLLSMRYAHYGGRSEIHLGDRILKVGVDRKADFVTNMWWCTLATASILPFIGVWSGMTVEWSPLKLIASHALLVFAICMTESICFHLMQRIPMATTCAIEENDHEESSDETESLMESSMPSYTS